MSTATQLEPRFRVWEWVSYPAGFRRSLGQIVEDRGPVGAHGRRLFQLQTDWGEEGGKSIEMPEADLEPAPPITTAERARENGLSTQNWPRQAFHVRYTSRDAGGSWAARMWPIAYWAVPPMQRGPTGLRYAGDEDSELVRVDAEYDPRLADPRTDKEVWTSLTEKAIRIADTVFEGKHPKARIDERHVEE
jgi:hypothetical protein